MSKNECQPSSISYNSSVEVHKVISYTSKHFYAVSVNPYYSRQNQPFLELILELNFGGKTWHLVRNKYLVYESGFIVSSTVNSRILMHFQVRQLLLSSTSRARSGHFSRTTSLVIVSLARDMQDVAES